jgi:hypothetical protein
LRWLQFEPDLPWGPVLLAFIQTCEENTVATESSKPVTKPNPEMEELPAPEPEDDGYLETLEDDYDEPSLGAGNDEMPQDVDHD